ncbi:IclR family transcriptional regulator [Pseudalkalibacillus sp. SCS-8]|uniref:IclR family transcriptional regulator n=1 Tax=Pseudalkalibacillus nanhaiensis TaxID=3115291 RepID=UPI0032DAA2BB
MREKNITVIKAMEILTFFKEHQSLSLKELTRLTRTPKTTVYRMILSLEDAGFLRKNQDGEYELGFSFLEYGQLVKSRLDIRRMALPIMKRLKDELGEAVNLIVREGEEAIYVEKIDTDKPVRVYTGIGRTAPLYAGACPRILLAYMSPEEQESYLENVFLKPFARGTITDKNRLITRLEECKESGYTISHSELHDDSSAIAAPIFDHENEVYAAISIVGPETRFRDMEALPYLIEKVKQAAEEISKALGWNRNTIFEVIS